MNILIIQPKLEKKIEQLKVELEKNPTIDIVIFPEGYLNENVEEACELARKYNTILICGYRRLNENPKDRAIIINRQGHIILDRVKYSCTAFIIEEGLKMGHILCDELIVQGIKVEKGNLDKDIDLIIHPIGVGMFSKAQFEEWITEAKKIAIEHKTMIIGTSHADGSYRNSSISIPIAYCFNPNGSAVFIAEDDVRTRMLNVDTKEVTFSIL
ncbi:hypothetical protein K0H71_16610 [Bacillus sp. IITD106]|nr:hypothetical protein [Bacillus sp. IITD106]